LKDYTNALQYSNKEYYIVKDNPKEAFDSLINIAKLSWHAGKMEDVEEILLKAKKIVRQNLQIEYR
jgi:hypothetical protein